jgi:acyl-CoA thioesterase
VAPACEATAVPQVASAQAMMARDQASRGLGIELASQAEGRAVTRMTVRTDMVNGHAVAHGGLIFTLADTAFACACNSYGPVTVAAAAEIVFVAPAHAGDVLTAEAVVRTRFGRAGVYDVTVRRGSDVIAEFRGRSHELAQPARPARPAGSGIGPRAGSAD